MSRSNTWSPSKESLLLQNLKKLEQSPLSEEQAKLYGSQSSINLDNTFIDLPTEPKRRRIMAEESPNALGSQVSSQMSSRSHSPTLSESNLDDSFISTPSMMSTPSASPSGTMKEHFRRKYHKDELWAAIETNYKYLMDKGIIEACQTTEIEREEIEDDSKVSFHEFLKQYKELSEWLKSIQSSLQAKKESTLALSEKYLSQSYYDEIQRSPRLQLFDDCARQLKMPQPMLNDKVDMTVLSLFFKNLSYYDEIQRSPRLQLFDDCARQLKMRQPMLTDKVDIFCIFSSKNLSYYDEIQRSPRLQLFDDCARQLKMRQPMLTDEVDVFLKEIHAQWDTVEKAVAPTNENQDPESMLRDLQDDLECLKKWLDGIEDHLRSQTSQDWPYEELDSVLADHKILQRDIESHSRVVSAVLKLSEKLNDDKNLLGYTVEQGSLEISAHNLERRWHGIWLQSLEWQCRLEDAISRKKGIFSTGPYLDSNYSNLREYTDDEYDTQDVNSSGDDSFNGLGYRRDFVQSPPHQDTSLSLSPGYDKSSGKDSAVASESEQKTSSDMSENYQDLSVSTGSESEREYLRNIKMRKRDSRDIGYGSESQSDEVDNRYQGQGITFSGISGRVKKLSTKSGDYYATVVTESTESNGSKTDSSVTKDQDVGTCDESDVSTQCQQVLMQEESEMEDIRYLIDQADIMVQQGNVFNKNFSPKHTSETKTDGQMNTDTKIDGSQKSLSSSSSGPAPNMVDKGVVTVESSCDASDEESGSEDPVEECSMITDDGTETIDSVMGSEYTSDEMKNGGRDNTKLPKLYDTNSLRARVKGHVKERPWSVIEMPNVSELQPLSASESAIDRVAGTHSDSEIPSASCSLSRTSSTPRHGVRRAQCLQRTNIRHVNTSRSQLGAKRKLSLDISINSERTQTQGQIKDSVKNPVNSESVNTINTNTEAGNNVNSEVIDSEMHTSGNCTVVPLGESCTSDDEARTPMPCGNDLIHTLQSARFKSSGSSYDDTDTQGMSKPGNCTVVPLGESCTSDDEARTPMPCGNDLIHTLQSARFKSSGSSYDDTDTQGEPGAPSEAEDPNNDGSFSENAWDNYQAPLYPTGSEEPLEEALTWDPGEMEFDDEFSMPHATILATLIARRSEDESYTNCHPKLVPSSKNKYVDSDSDIEELHHVLEESRIQLKVADRSLKKKRKDPLKTGLYMNPGKYGELLATIETNIRCLEAINQHLDQADVSQKDIQTMQDLLYKWEKLHALASERRDHSQEIKTMYATLLSIEGIVNQGVTEVEKSQFDSLEELNETVARIQDKQKLLQCQHQMLSHLKGSVSAFSAANPSINVECLLSKIHDLEVKLETDTYRCVKRLDELKHMTCVWMEYKQTDQELQSHIDGGLDKSLLSQDGQITSEKMDTQIEPVPIQIEEKMIVEEPVVQKTEILTTETRQRTKKPKSATKPKPRVEPEPRPSQSPGWLKIFPLSALALAVFIGLLYLFAPDVLFDLLGFSIRISPELKYVNGAPPM